MGDERIGGCGGLLLVVRLPVILGSGSVCWLSGECSGARGFGGGCFGTGACYCYWWWSGPYTFFVSRRDGR